MAPSISSRLVGPLLDDLGVILGIRGRRGLFEGLADRLVAAGLLEVSPAGQFVDQGDRVDRLAEVVEVADRPVDDLMAVAVEVLDLEQRHDVVERLVVEQEAAEDAQLGLDILGREPVELDGRRMFAVLPRTAVAVPVDVPIPIRVAIRILGHDPTRLRPRSATRHQVASPTHRLNLGPARNRW